mmetsp:Transcript_37014/g.71727  ORF Transcript_37014/g.71727 Transcript_37014/m.71727 type:complete len:443 (-) Transcript_37014:206-1534(-)
MKAWRRLAPLWPHRSPSIPISSTNSWPRRQVATGRFLKSLAGVSMAFPKVWRGVATESKRIQATDEPCIVMMQGLLKGKRDVSKLSQGVVHWQPPPEALDAARKAIEDPTVHGYGNDEGSMELRDAVKEKLKKENNITESEVIITTGANQAFANLVVALTDEEDTVIMFAPYYFNHKMAVQMTGGSRNLELGAVDPETLIPSPEWVEKRLADDPKGVKMVVLCSPCNPTGVVIPEETLRSISEACKKAGVWLVIDNTYEYFTYGDAKHSTLEDSHICNIFSFSKAYGMMGWRMGYVAYPPNIRSALLKAQDTIPICPTQISERVALGALQAGRPYVDQNLPSVVKNRDTIISALQPLRVIGGQGAIYLMAELPEKYRDCDIEVVKWLIDTHHLAVIPGTSCGAPGFIRLSYANIVGDAMELAAERLRTAIQALLSDDAPKFK